MKQVTDYILGRTNRLQVIPEPSPGDHKFLAFNDAGTEIEVSEFLYSFVRMIKPKLVLETGTHVGVSSTYMAQALVDNAQGGKLITFEVIREHQENAIRLWQEVGVADVIESRLEESLKYNPEDQKFQMLFLDSEPQLRFAEFVKLWPYLEENGFILIHDLHPHLAHTGIINPDHPDEPDWPYGDFRKSIGPYILNHQVQTISFPTPRGFTLFQKMSSAHGAYNLLTGSI